MVRNTWIGINNKRWRYFGSDGRYVKKGIGAYKVLKNSSNLYLLDANGYLIKGKQVKGADGYYYMSNSSGIAYANRLVKIGNYRYYFTSNGRRATWRNRWVQLAGYRLHQVWQILLLRKHCRTYTREEGNAEGNCQ